MNTPEIAPFPQQWQVVGTCGRCGGAVMSPWIWDTDGTITGSPRPCHCIVCKKEPKVHPGFSWGPKLEMKS